MPPSCTHLSQIRDVKPSAPGFEDCLKMKDRWVHLRMCLTCGHVVFTGKDFQRSLVFYRDLLGFQEDGRVFNGAAAALISSRTQLETAQKVAELASKKFDSIDAAVANDPIESDMRN